MLVARVIPIARSVVSIPAGMMRMSLARFMVLTTIGSLVWNLVLVYAGKQLGANWEDVTNVVETYALPLRIAVVLGFAAGCAWLLRRRQRRGATPVG